MYFWAGSRHFMLFSSSNERATNERIIYPHYRRKTAPSASGCYGTGYAHAHRNGWRASKGGLLIAEATAISPYANAYADAPGIFTHLQQAGWKRAVDTVHGRGGQIVLQLWYPGRQSLPELSEGHQPVAPSALTARETYGVGKHTDGTYEGKYRRSRLRRMNDCCED